MNITFTDSLALVSALIGVVVSISSSVSAWKMTISMHKAHLVIDKSKTGSTTIPLKNGLYSAEELLLEVSERMDDIPEGLRTQWRSRQRHSLNWYRFVRLFSFGARRKGSISKD